VNEELIETLDDLSDYYTSITGYNITMGVDATDDVYLLSNRTNGKEYFDSLEEVERRVKILYNDLLPDDDDDSGLEDF
jgi:ABC-type tungstate transport system permease subunit